ncbi:MAG: hypothetical protein VYE22_32960 [Myxococcota bacterium]|nr:hypothetical protein [Myxococcota bacterium]
MALFAIVPWVLFGIMVLFGLIFAIVAWRATRRAGDQEEAAERAKMALSQMEARARAAEGQIADAQARAQRAEASIADAEERARRAEQAAEDARRAAAQASGQAQQALQRAQQADSALQQRRDEAAEKQRKAQGRARSLLSWARQQWESRREADRQKAQGVEGSFQAQLDAFLGHRRAPVTFRVEGEIDRMAAPLLGQYVQDEDVQVDGDLVRVTYPVDPSLGFRA